MAEPAAPAGLDADLAALRDAGAARGLPPMTAISPAEARERVRAGQRLCTGGPQDLAVADLATGPDGPPVPVRVYEGGRSDVTLVYAHGGGWVTGDLDYADETCRHLAAEAGCRVVDVDYRLAPEHPFPAGLDDLQATFAWVRQRHAGPVALAGDSAGGNLAAALVHRLLAAGGPAPAFLVLAYPVLGLPGRTRSYREHAHAFPIGADDMDWFLAHYAPPTDERSSDLAPLHAVSLRGHPRTHLVLAGHDPLHDEGAAYAHLLSRHQVKVSVVDHPTLCHGFLRFTGAAPAAAAARDQLVRDVRRLVRSATPVPVQIGATRGWPNTADEENHAYDSPMTTGDSAPGDPQGSAHDH